MTVAEAAGRVRVSESVIRAWVADGTLPHYRLGRTGRRGKIAIAADDLDRAVAGFRVGGAKPPPAADHPPLKHLRLK